VNRFAYCPKCREVFETQMLNMKYEYGCKCPTPNCDGEAFGIDEEMIIPIDILNQKGYKTMWCCSGHVFTENGGDDYIAFIEGSFPKTIPDGWYSDEKYNAIRYRVPNKSPILKRKDVVKHIDNLIEWAVKLPSQK